MPATKTVLVFRKHVLLLLSLRACAIRPIDGWRVAQAVTMGEALEVCTMNYGRAATDL